ncbi:SulP family inorganic anion transporter [Pseudemcibacter aquimaris]|uniref:SulP family inorganic anion transporter n=1 Tax=Pseudemcibacter aquimaris TaxID=2857064 RepID=UPI002012B295|nr:SulP family inorganic anion transporter [Pseudemcibacter aquimaris]MCC3862507.1 SulP family inorganic anion transporter [Pseudemcibacter aquimaris]WDU57769.1 SulP family inorganic anion transporter [Pseudemcibacter aquimaris]
MSFLNTSNLRGDIMGGLTTGIVALPLALAFGEASGAGPMAGLYGAIIVGFLASLFGGTGSNISGPTGPMVVVFAGVYTSLGGSPELVFSAVVLAGLLQIAFGFLKVGQLIRLVPYPVVSGFMSGIGVIIIALQLSRLFGHEPSGSGTIPALTSVPGAIIDPNWIALAIGLMTLAIVFYWPKKLGKYIPAPLAALVVATVFSAAIAGAPILGDVPSGLPSFVMPAFEQESFLIVIEAAFLLALLGAIDSLLTSLVADNMTRTRHNSNQELIGQGIGNTVAGLFGGVPGAGATMRTVVNIRSGGQFKISGMIHGLVLLAIALVLAPLASMIPHAALAGILIKVGYDIIDWRYLARAHRGPRWDLVLMAIVLGLTVFVDLITAVAVGVVLAALAFIKQLSEIQLKNLNLSEAEIENPQERELLTRADGAVTLFDFGGPLSFGAAADLGHHVREKANGHVKILVLDFARVPFLDLSAVKAVETIVEDAAASGKSVYIAGINKAVSDVLHGLDVAPLITDDHWFDNRHDALAQAVVEIGQDEGKETSAPEGEAAYA